MVDTETEFFIRDKENLDDFLYELDSSYVKKDSAKLFDYLDMIFITGDANLLPWHPHQLEESSKHNRNFKRTFKLYDDYEKMEKINKHMLA